MKFDDVIVNHIGEFGLYQKTQLILLCLPSLITSINALSWTFAGADVLHSHPEWKSCPFDECNFQNGTTCAETGNGFVFDRSIVSYSAVERWEFVCDWSVLKAVIQSAYYIGQMAGSLIFGFLGDRIGRRSVFFIAIVLQIIGTAGLAVSPHWLLYGLFRICVLLGGLAYFVRDYQLLHAYVAILAIFFLSYWWIVPESARWLISQERYEEADKVLRTAARINGRQLPERWWQDIDDYSKESKPARKHNYFDLVRTPRIRTISLATFFCWPVVSMVYYGMSMKTDFLGGDMYTTFIFGGLVEIPALILMFSIVDRIGRKPIICCGYSIAAICMISNLWLNVET
uniref:Organic cation transporter n=1 Tax=Meloidogyne javanica TaxID=6303 RepID=A0A915M9J7_MELJA